MFIVDVVVVMFRLWSMKADEDEAKQWADDLI